MSAKYVINQIHRFNFLAVNDFRVNLRGLHVGVSEQFRYRVEVCTERQHHRGERVPTGVIGDFLGYLGCLHPLGQYLVNIGFGRQAIKDF